MVVRHTNGLARGRRISHDCQTILTTSTAACITAIVHFAGGVSFFASAPCAETLTQGLARYVLGRCDDVLWPDAAQRVRALLDEGSLNEAIALYFERTGSRWERERLELVAMGNGENRIPDAEQRPMQDADWLAERFDRARGHLRAVAYRMLGSVPDAEDAVQEAWLRLSRTDASEIENINGWLTTVVARVSLNMLQSRGVRREETLDGHVPDPIVTLTDPRDPEQQAVLADSVGLALLVVLDALAPAERLAFVLHDMFDIPFEQIASMVDRTPAAARQLASRARQRVRAAAVPDPDRITQQRVADAFLAAVREGNIQGLIDVLHPDVVFRIDGGTQRPGATRVVRGAHAVVEGAMRFASTAPYARQVLVNGAPGFVGRHPDGRIMSVIGMTIRHGKIVELHAVTDAERLGKLDLPAL
jgi:RNA polymerase sigma factor (sigma-70 family)